MKIIFFGSDDFAVVNLNAVVNAGHQVVACVTAPDRPKGRGMHVVSSPVAEFAERKKIPVLKPERLRDGDLIQRLKDCEAQLFVVIAYGKILPPELLAVPKIAAINSHGSLLPKYRGAAPINWALINGDAETGISIIKMNPQLDAGDVIAQERLKIDPHDTAVTLRAKLSALSATCLCRTVLALGQGECHPVVQDARQVSLAPKLTKELGHIDWQKPAAQIHNLVRGLLPWPTAYTHFNGKLLKILETGIGEHSSFQPGVIGAVTPKGLSVGTGDGALLIKRVHPESGKEMAAVDFLHGHKLQVGQRLG